MKLKIKDVDFKNKAITIVAENSKNKKEDIIPANAIVEQIFKNLIEENGGRSEFMFNYSSNGNYGSLNYVDRGFTTACKRAKIQQLQFRDLRTTFGTRMAKHANPFVLQKLMRHSDIRITMRYYVKIDFSSMANAVEKLNGNNGNGSKDEKLLSICGISESPEIQQASKPTYLQ